MKYSKNNFIIEEINSKNRNKFHILNKKFLNFNNSKNTIISYYSNINDNNSLTLSNSKYVNSLGNSINNTISNSITNSSTPYIPCAMSAAIICGNNKKFSMKINEKQHKKIQNFKNIKGVISTNLSVNCNNINKIPYKQLNNKTEQNLKIPNNNNNNYSSTIKKTSKNKITNSPKNKVLKKPLSYRIKLKKDENISLKTYRSMKNITKNRNKIKKFNVVGRNYSNNYNPGYLTNNNISDKKYKINIKKKSHRINSKNNISTSQNKKIYKTFSNSFTNIIPKSPKNSRRGSFNVLRENTGLKNDNHNSYSKNKVKKVTKLNNNNINETSLFGELFKEFRNFFDNNLKICKNNTSRINKNFNDVIQLRKQKLTNKFKKKKYYTQGNINKNDLKKNGIVNSKYKNPIPKNFKISRKSHSNNKIKILKKNYQYKLEEVKDRINALFDNYMTIIDLINNSNKNN